jgi:hypothetical protein
VAVKETAAKVEEAAAKAAEAAAVAAGKAAAKLALGKQGPSAAEEI